jgi:hypothetical protein
MLRKIKEDEKISFLSIFESLNFSKVTCLAPNCLTPHRILQLGQLTTSKLFPSNQFSALIEFYWHFTVFFAASNMNLN